MKRCFAILITTLLIPLITGCARFQNAINVREPYSCRFAATPITVDGELNEPVWQQAEPLDFYVLESFTKPVSLTEAKIVYDKDCLYVAFKAYDKDIYAMAKERDTETCRDDVLEIFFKIHPDKNPYYNFEINVLGAVYDAYVIKRNAAGNALRWSQWNCAGLKVAIKITGTLNNLDDVDDYWTMEAAIPFADLPTLEGKAPARGAEWLFSLARYDYSVHLPEGRELSSTSRFKKRDFHRFEDWRKIIFN